MLTNFHTHTTFCDGSGTPEEVVRSAIAEGFDAIGFSGHGYTEYDLRYCMKDTVGYISEIVRLREAYKGKIEIYLGIEEDSRHINNRADFDYVIGSCHYAKKGSLVYPIDSGKRRKDHFDKALALFDNDPLLFAESYYSHFTEYLKKWKPDIIGHFDLITKFDEVDEPLFLGNKEYQKIAEKYTREALKVGSLFEVNTGAISRGLRTLPYPHPSLLDIIRREGGGVILSSDSHSLGTLAFYFKEARAMLRDIGFNFVYTIKNGEFIKDYI